MIERLIGRTALVGCISAVLLFAIAFAVVTELSSRPEAPIAHKR